MGILNRQPKNLPTPESINELKRQGMRLEQVNSALRERDKVLFDMVGKAVQIRDTPRAQIYANELSRVRSIKRIISQSQLAVDCITIRLENFLDLYQVVQEMKPISEVIREVSIDVQQVMPQFATVLEQLNEVASEALTQTTIDLHQPALEEAINVRSQGGADIIKEASDLVENSLHESFPEPPITMISREAEELACSDESTCISRTTQVSNEATDLGELSDEVINILDRIGF